jgi:exopolysaccharide biosynthesis polyprenyl glycosylphosphotransferase
MLTGGLETTAARPDTSVDDADHRTAHFKSAGAGTSRRRFPRRGVPSSARTIESTAVAVDDSAESAPVASPIERPSRRRAHAAPTGNARWQRKYRYALLLVDFVAAALGTALAYSLRFGAPTHGDHGLYLGLALALPVLWIVSIGLCRGYEERTLGVGVAEFQVVGRAFVLLAAGIAVASYVTKADLARGFVIVAVGVTLAVDLLGRIAVRKSVHRIRRNGRAMSKVVVVGGVDSVITLAASLARESHAGLQVVGACVPVGSVSDPVVVSRLAAAGVVLLGDLDSVLSAVGSVGADTVAIASSHEVGSQRLRWISWQLEGSAVDLVVSPGLVEVAGSRLHIRAVTGLPLLVVEQPRFSGWARVVKSLLDRVVALSALVVLAPVFVVVAGLVWCEDRGPVLFRQTRVGRGGRRFTMVKFRSMSVDAESRLGELVGANEAADGLLFKMRVDPRVTRVGRVLRKFSVDELPQLWNVVCGSMSLVGPRPPLPVEVERYGDDVARRLLVRPGLTGLWQVSGRSDLSWEESVRLDLRYVENWTLALDVLVLWKTARAVFASIGAY